MFSINVDSFEIKEINIDINKTTSQNIVIVGSKLYFINETQLLSSLNLHTHTVEVYEKYAKCISITSFTNMLAVFSA